MARKRYVTEKRYTIHFFSYGHNYKSTSNCTKEYVQECRQWIKLIKGESIKVELDRVIKWEY